MNVSHLQESLLRSSMASLDESERYSGGEAHRCFMIVPSLLYPILCSVPLLHPINCSYEGPCSSSQHSYLQLQSVATSVVNWLWGE